MTPIETLLTTAFQKGEWFEFGQTKEERIPNASWGSDRSIPAQSIFEILLHQDSQSLIHPKGIRIRGARIVDKLDLTGLTLAMPFRLEHCWLDDILFLDDFVGTTVSLSGSRVPGVRGERMALKNGLFINNGFTCDGEFDLRDATIAGSIDGTGAKFRNLNGNSFTGTRLKMGGGIYFKDVISQGELRFVDAQIGGSFSCQGGDVLNPGGSVIDATRASIKGGVFLNKDFRSGKPDEKGFAARGQINFFQTQIGGTLELAGANIENANAVALRAIGITVRGAVLLNRNFQSLGMIDFSFGTFGGTIECNHAELRNPGQTAFLAGNANIAAYITFGDKVPATKETKSFRNFRMEGAISLRGAAIGELTCRKGIYIHPQKELLDVTAANIRNGMHLMRGAQMDGGIRLVAAKVGVDLDIRGSISCKEFSAINAESLQIGNDLSLETAEIVGNINLRNAKAGRLKINPRNWQHDNSFLLENFEYRTFNEMGVTDRLAWLRSQKPWSLQPYEQAAKTLRLLGFTREARIVGRAQKNDMRKYGHLKRNAKIWNWFLDFSIGHGYEVWRLVIFASFIIALGSGIFWWADHSGSMTAIKEGFHPDFHAVVYSADVFLPGVNLHQKEYWLPDTEFGGNCGYMAWLWFETCLGWLATTLAIAGLSGIVKKD